MNRTERNELVEIDDCVCGTAGRHRAFVDDARSADTKLVFRAMVRTCVVGRLACADCDLSGYFLGVTFLLAVAFCFGRVVGFGASEAT
jgi:hypothetical protein